VVYTVFGRLEVAAPVGLVDTALKNFIYLPMSGPGTASLAPGW